MSRPTWVRIGPKERKETRQEDAHRVNWTDGGVTTTCGLGLLGIQLSYLQRKPKANLCAECDP